jgi:FIMAH domain
MRRLLVTLLCCAWFASAAASSAPFAGTISGTVTAPGSLSGISVSIYNTGGSFVTSASVDPLTGAYTTPVVADGTYYARTNVLGGAYLNQLWNGITCTSCNPITGTPIVISGGSVSGIDFNLVAAGHISGTITNEVVPGPVAGVQVTILTPGNTFVTSVTTDASGFFSTALGFTGLPAGTYYVRTDDNTQGFINELYNNVPCLLSFSCPLTSATPVVVTSGSTTTGIDFALRPGGRFTGTITDASTSLPIVVAPGVTRPQVDVLDAAGQTVSRTTSDASGVYFSRGLPTGSYFLRTLNNSGYINRAHDGTICIPSCAVTSLAPIAVTEGATVGANFSLEAGGRVSGVVRDVATSAGLSLISVNIYSSTGQFLTSGLTNALGEYTSNDGLPSGSYFASTFNGRGYINRLYNDIECPAGCSPTFGAPIVVTSGITTSGIDFNLQAGGRFTGLVTAVGGTPVLTGVTVNVLNASGTTISSGFTDVSGHYTTGAGLVAGSYYLQTSNSQGYINERHLNVSCVGTVCPGAPSGAAVAIAPGGLVTVDFDLVAGGRISGSVLDDDVPAAAVPGSTVSIIDGTGATLSSGTVDSLGNYISGAGLPAGTYYARTNNSVGFINELYDDLPCPSGCNVSAGTAIPVAAAATTSGVNFVLTAGARITGQVTSAATSLPLPNVSVTVSTPNGSSAGFATTDSTGSFAVGGLVAGTYYARTSNTFGYIDKLYDGIPCGTGCPPFTGTPIVVGTGATVSGIDFSLAIGGRVSGTLTDAATSLPVSGATVQILTSSGAVVTTGRTDLSGNYITGSGIATGTYYVRASSTTGHITQLYSGIPCAGTCTIVAGTPISVVEGSTTGGIDFVMEAGGRVSGTVIDSATSTPIPTVQIQIVDPNGRTIATATTDGSGNYITGAGVPSGTYYARTSNGLGYINEIYNNKPCPQTCPVISGDSFSVTIGSTTSGINFSLDRGGRIAGTIIDSATAQPIGGAFVTIYDASGRRWSTASTNQFGQYVSGAGLPAGTYFATADDDLGHIPQLYSGFPCSSTSTCSVTSGTPITVTGTATTNGIDFSLVLGARISGTVTNTTTSLPAANVGVLVLDASGIVLSTGTTNALGNDTTTSGLPDGSYYVRTTNNQGLINRLWATPTTLECVGPSSGTSPACIVTTGTPVAVTAGTITSNIDFGLAAGGRVGGTVTLAAGGTPLTPVQVVVYSAAGMRLTGGTTDGTGVYRTSEGLPTGTYYARTENSLGLVNKVYNDVTCSTSCVPTAGTPIGVTAGSTTLGIDFALEPDTDPDGDGIAATIDLDVAFSNAFSDVAQGGTTDGVLTARNGWTVNVGDVSPGGVQVSLAGSGGAAATLEVCSAGGAEGIALDAAGEIGLTQCSPTGSTFLRAVVALPTIELRDPPTGPGVLILLTTGQAATVGSPIEASPANTESITVLFVDGTNTPYGSMDLDPGEIVNVDVDSAGNVEATVENGVVTITVGSETQTLAAGESASFESPLVNLDGVFDAIIAQVQGFVASGDIRTRGIGNSLIAQLRDAKQLSHTDRAAATAAVQQLITRVEQLYKTRQISQTARAALIASLQALLAQL